MLKKIFSLTLLLLFLIIVLENYTASPDGYPDIRISGNDDFKKCKYVIRGDGTKSNPYIIRVDIANWVEIRDTDKYFILEFSKITLGIMLDHVSNGDICGSEITEEKNLGISISSCNNINVFSIKIMNTNRSGPKSIWIKESQNILIKEVTILNSQGIVIENSRDIVIDRVYIKNKESMAGISVYKSNVKIYHSTILGPKIITFTGIEIYGSKNCEIAHNIIRYCTTGMNLYNSTDCLIYDNFFANNSIDALDNSGGKNKWNLDHKIPGKNIIGGPYLGGNYWERYKGIDLDGDGIGDTNIPYISLPGYPCPLCIKDFMPLVYYSKPPEGLDLFIGLLNVSLSERYISPGTMLTVIYTVDKIGKMEEIESTSEITVRETVYLVKTIYGENNATKMGVKKVLYNNLRDISLNEIGNSFSFTYTFPILNVSDVNGILVCIQVDVNNVIKEVDEENNYRCESLPFVFKFLPDIMIEKMDLVWSPLIPYPDTPLYLYLTVHNIGKNVTGVFKVKAVLHIYVNESNNIVEKEIWFESSCNLRPGESLTLYLPCKSKNDPYIVPENVVNDSDHLNYIEVWADYENVVEEISEDNNYISKFININPEGPPSYTEPWNGDLELKIIRVDKPIYPGGVITVHFKTINTIPIYRLTYEVLTRFEVTLRHNLSETPYTFNLASLFTGFGIENGKPAAYFILNIPAPYYSSEYARHIYLNLTLTGGEGGNPLFGLNNFDETTVDLMLVQPDLEIVSLLDVYPNPIQYGVPARFCVKIANNGKGVAKNFKLKIYFRSYPNQVAEMVQVKDIDILYPYSETTIVFTFSSISEEVDEACFIVDVEDTVAESNEDNNEKCFRIRCEMPNIVVNRVLQDGQHVGIIYGAQSAPISFDVEIKIYFGGSFSKHIDGFKVKLRLLDEYGYMVADLGEYEVNDIYVGGSAGYSATKYLHIDWNVPEDIGAGDYVLKIIVDSENQVPEENEQDNIYTIQFKIKRNLPPLIILRQINPSSERTTSENQPLYIVHTGSVEIRVDVTDLHPGDLRGLIKYVNFSIYWENPNGEYSEEDLLYFSPNWVWKDYITLHLEYYCNLPQGRYVWVISAIDDDGAISKLEIKVYVIDISIQLKGLVFYPPEDLFSVDNSANSATLSIRVSSIHPHTLLFKLRGDVVKDLLQSAGWSSQEDPEAFSYQFTPSEESLEEDINFPPIPLSHITDRYEFISGYKGGSRMNLWLDIYVFTQEFGEILIESIDLSFNVEQPIISVCYASSDNPIMPGEAHDLEVYVTNEGNENYLIQSFRIIEEYGEENDPIVYLPRTYGYSINIDGTGVMFRGLDPEEVIEEEDVAKYLDYEGDVVIKLIYKWTDIHGNEHNSLALGCGILRTTPFVIQVKRNSELCFVRYMDVWNNFPHDIMLQITPRDVVMKTSPLNRLYENPIIILRTDWDGESTDFNRATLRPYSQYYEVKRFILFFDPTRYTYISTYKSVIWLTVSYGQYSYDENTYIMAIDITYEQRHFVHTGYSPVLYGFHFKNYKLPLQLTFHCCGMSWCSGASFYYRERGKDYFPSCRYEEEEEEACEKAVKRLKNNYPVTIKRSDVSFVIEKMQGDLAICLCIPNSNKRDVFNAIIHELNSRRCILFCVDRADPNSYPSCHMVLLSGYIDTGDSVYFYGYDPNYPASEKYIWLKKPFDAIGIIRPIIRFDRNSCNFVYLPAGTVPGVNWRNVRP